MTTARDHTPQPDQGPKPTPAQRRIANRSAFYADKAARARTPIERVTVAFDQWRGDLGELPEGQAAHFADRLTAAINAQITEIAQTFAQEGS